MTIGSPATAACRPASASLVAVRMKEMTAVVQRRISSTALGTSDRSATRRSHWSGFSARATSPPEMVLRVVSLPATSSWLRNIASSSSVRRSPSTSRLASRR